MTIKLNHGKSNYEKWYDENKHLYKNFEIKIKDLIEDILVNEEINYSSVFSRIKSKDSFIQKIENKEYENPLNEITDVIGIRIVVYTNTDVEIVSRLIEDEFLIDEENSMNKSDIMKVNEVGYLSVHYIAELKEKHFEIATFKNFESKDIKFEIQIRTVLQHAWAEIEHDQNYKYKGELPQDLKRKFNILAGGLELIDNNFDNINNDLNIYSDKVKYGIENGNYKFKIDTVSIYNYFEFLIEKEDLKCNYDLQKLNKECSNKKIINALKEYGFNSLEDLNQLFNCDKKLNFNMIEESFSNSKSIMGNFFLYMYEKDNNEFLKKTNKNLYSLYKKINEISNKNKIKKLNQ